MMLTKAEREALYNNIMFCSCIVGDTRLHGIHMTMTVERMEELATAVQSTVVSKADLEDVVTVLSWLVLHNLWEVGKMAHRPQSKGYVPSESTQHFINVRGKLLELLEEQGRLLGAMMSVAKAVASSEG